MTPSQKPAFLRIKNNIRHRYICVIEGLNAREVAKYSNFGRSFLYDVVIKQLLGLSRFQNLLLIVYDRIKTICAIIQRLFGQNKVITRFDGRRCIDD